MATTEDWTDIGTGAASGHGTHSRCILELRARIEALEAQAAQPEPLISAAQAVLHAVTAQLDLDARYHSHSAAAAALRAAALYCPVDRRVLMTIADELDS